MDMLTGWLGPWYLPVKAFHIIVTFFWVAGLFMLPRYLAYQAATPPGSPEEALWSERTGRLRRIILTPSLILAWVLGLAVATSYGFSGAGWIHVKILLVLLLSGYHGWMVSNLKKMAAGERPLTEKALRLWNEVPAVFTIAIVFLAVLKPFTRA